MPRVATRLDLPALPKAKPTLDLTGHRPFQEFSVATLDELVKQLEREGQGIDVLMIEGVRHLVCGKPLSSILVQANAVRQLPEDLVAVYQYCQGCKTAVRVL